MDNAQKAIMLGVGLFITIIVIAAVMAITGVGQDLIGSGQSQISGLSSQLAATVQKSYDNVKLTGSQVRTAIQKYYNEEGISVYLVETMMGTGNEATKLVSTSFATAKDSQVGTFTAPFVCTPSYIDMSTVTTKTVTVSPSGVTNSMNISGITVANGYFKTFTEGARTPLATLTSTVQANGRYKSTLIINEATSEIMGILFARYQ